MEKQAQKPAFLSFYIKFACLSKKKCIFAPTYRNILYRTGGDFRSLIIKIGEIDARIFETYGVDVGDVVALDVHCDLVRLKSAYAGPK